MDKNLSEKLKIFDCIDKKYWPNLHESNIRKSEISNITESKDFLQKIKYSNSEIYDNIYSDFKISQINTYFYSPSTNTVNSNITKHYSKINLKKIQKILEIIIQTQMKIY